MRRGFLLLGCACLASMTFAWCGPASASSAVVWIALSDRGGVYAETSEALRAELERSGGRVEVLARPWRDLLAADGPQPRLVVAVGVGALRGVAESEVRAPLLGVLVPRAVYLRIAEPAGRAGRQISAIWLDQPIMRQLDLLRLALPTRHRVGALLGPESKLFEAELQRAAAERNLELVAARIEGGEHLAGAVQRVLAEADVLLALPDSQVYNGATVQNVLTAAYRQRVPLIGFSPAYVKAGAMMSLYSTPAQVGAQAAEIVRSVLGGRPLPPPQGPRAFAVGVNADVARSLGIAMEEDAAARWTERLAREKGP